jgi:hypothetical protein
MMSVDRWAALAFGGGGEEEPQARGERGREELLRLGEVF